MTASDVRWLSADPPFSVLGQQEGDQGAFLRQAYGCFPTGVVGVCALIDGTPVGLAASSFVPVSIDPPLVSFCIQKTSQTWSKLVAAPRLGISFLGHGHDLAVRKLASRAEDKFEGMSLGVTEVGAVLIDGATVWLECVVDSTLPGGDHDIVLLRITALTMRPHIEPLVFHGSAFRKLLSPPA